MTQTVQLSAFFERSERDRDGFPAESYVAGFRELNGSAISVEIILPADLVEQTVLSNSRLSVGLASDGRLVLDAEGLGGQTMASANVAGGVREQTLESLMTACLDPELLASEDDAVGDLTLLRAQLVRALAQLDATLERLKQG